MTQLTIFDLDFILESLEYTRHKFENYPIGEKGYPSYEIKQKRMEEVNSVLSKVRALKQELKKANS